MTIFGGIMLYLFLCSFLVCVQDRRQHAKEKAAIYQEWLASMKETAAIYQRSMGVAKVTIEALTQELERARAADGDGVLVVPPDGRRPS